MPGSVAALPETRMWMSAFEKKLEPNQPTV